MNCPNCSQPVEADAAFCGNCGQALQTPAQQSPLARGYANAKPQGSDQDTFSAPATAGATLQAIALPVTTRSGEVMAILAVLAGVLGLPGGIIPILGLGLGIASIVMGSLALNTQKRTLAIVGLVIGCV